MVNKRQDLEKQLTKYSTARDRIAGQLEETEAKVTQLQMDVNNDMLETGASSSLQELGLSREKVTSLRQTLQFATSQVDGARQELEDFDRAARGGMIMDLDLKVRQLIVVLQNKIGETGLKGEVDKLGELIVELERLSNSDIQVLDAAEHLNAARNFHDLISRSLFESWQAIEALHWGPGHAPASNRPNYIPGFGVRPGNLISG